MVDALGGVDLEIDEDERVTANDYITCMCEDNGDDPEDYYIEKAWTGTSEWLSGCWLCT